MWALQDLPSCSEILGAEAKGRCLLQGSALQLLGGSTLLAQPQQISRV